MSSKNKRRIQGFLPVVLPSAIFLTLFMLSKYEAAGFEQIGYAIGYYGWKALQFVMGAF